VSDQVLDHRPDVRSDQKFDHRPLGFVFILHTASLYVSMGLTKPDIAALEALPPQALAQIPGEAPPNSVIPNFAHPKSNEQLILGLSYFFFAGALICFSLRIWTRAFYMKRWQWDDGE
jgi:hypothetical protein